MNSTPPRETALVLGSAACLALATAWTVLINTGVLIGDPPAWLPDTAAEANLERYYTWAATTLDHERGALALMCLGLIGVVVAAIRIARRGGTGQVAASIGVAGGAATWGLAGIAHAGGWRAIELMTASENPIEIVNSIAFTIDTAATWMRAGASALIGLGMAALALGRGSAPWRWLCGAGAVAACSFAVLLLASSLWSDEAARYAGLALGGVLLPAWVATAWLSQDAPTGGRSATPAARPASQPAGTALQTT
jgi:hypothetical protein